MAEEFHGEQMAHLVVNGKSFFFNRKKTRHKQEYLRINALSGDFRESISFFPNQVKEFQETLEDVIFRMGWDD